MSDSVIQRSFGGGELAPSLSARADLDAYATGLRTCRNFIVQRHGGAAYRPGSRFVAAAKSAAATCGLYPFVYPSSDESYVIEAGDGFLRFYKNGARVTVSGVSAWSGATAYAVGDLVVQGGTNYYCILAHTNQVPPNATYWYALSGDIYEVPTPYAGAIFATPATRPRFYQSGDVVTITHASYAPRELRRHSATRWVLTTVTTAPTIAAPANLAVTYAGAGERSFGYVVTAIAASGEESLVSNAVTNTAVVEPTGDDPHVLTWDAVSGAVEYRVYCDAYQNGVYGFIGTAGQASFRDVGFVPDLAITPAPLRTLFASTNNYPAVSATVQQRRAFARTNADPETIFASRVGLPKNFDVSSPLRDDDAVTFQLASNLVQPVQHLLELAAGLVVLTDQGEWLVTGADGSRSPITPSSIEPYRHGYVGASATPPVTIGDTVLFVQARGRVLRDLRFDERVDGLSGRDLSLFAGHLFEGKTVTDMDYAQVPNSVVWCVRSDGTLLGLTYVREDQQFGWHRHDTDGTYEQVCVIPEGEEDATYVLVRRTVDGSTVRYVERFASPFFDELEDAFFVDCGLTVTNGSASTAVSGLSHLEARSVYALADGEVQGPFTVSSGAITLTTAATKVHVGLVYTGILETLDLDIASLAVRDALKRQVTTGLLLERSVRGFEVGPDEDHLVPLTADEWDESGPFTGREEVAPASAFSHEGRIVIRNARPLPLTVLAVMPHVEVGG